MCVSVLQTSPRRWNSGNKNEKAKNKTFCRASMSYRSVVPFPLNHDFEYVFFRAGKLDLSFFEKSSRRESIVRGVVLCISASTKVAGTQYSLFRVVSKEHDQEIVADVFELRRGRPARIHWRSLRGDQAAFHQGPGQRPRRYANSLIVRLHPGPVRSLTNSLSDDCSR